MRLGDKNFEKDIPAIRAEAATATVPGIPTDHGYLLGLGDDDHAQYVHISATRTIQAVHTFNPVAPGPPFALGGNAQDQLVTGLYADHVNKSIFPGDGMVGGGSLGSGSGVTLDIAAGDTSMTINPDSIQVRLASPDSGITVASGLTLGTPGAVTVSSDNTITGASHTHRVTASSDVSAGTASILKSTSAGGLGLGSLFTSGAVDVGQGFTSGATSLRAIHHTHGGVDHTHLVINPSGSWSLDEQFGVDIDDNLLVRGWIVGKHALQIPDALMIAHFDGPEPYETNYTGEAIGHMGQVPTQTGGVIFRPGKFGKGVSVGHTATNELKNPQFYYNYTDDWNFFDSTGDGAIYRKTDRFYIGVASVQLIANTGGTTYIRSGTNISVANGQTVWLQARIWRAGSTPTYAMDFWDQTNSTQRGLVNTLTKTKEWELVTTSWTNDTGSTVNVRAEIKNNTGNTTSSIFIDAVQLELDTMTQYLDGSLGLSPGQAQSDSASGTEFNGHSWSGTAHNSTSNRTQGVLQYSLDMPRYPVAPSEWTVSFWFRPVLLNTEATIYNNLFQWLYDNDNRVILAYNPANGNLYVSFIGNGSNSTIAYASALTRDEWHHAAVTYDGTTCTFYINGAEVGNASPTAMVSTPNLFRFGYAGNDFPGFLDDLAVAGSCFDADLIRAIRESNAPLFAESSTWHWRAAQNLLWADSEGLWMYDQDGVPVLGVSGADNKSWGGATLNKGDILYGRYGAADGGWFWFDRDGVSSKPYLKLGYADQTVWQFDYAGATLNGVLDISTSGGIYQGSSGSFQTPGTGLKMWNESDVGRIAGFNGGNIQAGFDTDGRLYAGGTDVQLDATGLLLNSSLSAAGIFTFGGNVKWRRPGTTTVIGSIGVHCGTTYGARNEMTIHVGDASLNVITIDADALDIKGGTTAYGDFSLYADFIVQSGGISSGIGSPPGTGNLEYSADLVAYRHGNADAYNVYPMHYLLSPLTSTNWDGDPRSTTGKTKIDLSTVFGVPAGVKAVLCKISLRDSGSAAGDAWFMLSPNNTDSVGLAGQVSGIRDNAIHDYALVVPCDANGDVYYQCVATGSGTLDVWLQIWGYAP